MSWNQLHKLSRIAHPGSITCEMGASCSVYNRNMHDVLVYSRKGCHLCEVVKEMLIQVQGEANFRWREVDIDFDPELRRKYNEEV